MNFLKHLQQDAAIALTGLNCLFECYPEGFATLSRSAMPEATSAVHRSKLRKTLPQRKIDVKVELPVGSVSAFTLIRTDTTLDHSQKAEKVWYGTTLHFGGFGSFCPPPPP